MNCEFESDVEACDYVAVGENGKLKVARHGDWVIGQAFKSIIFRKDDQLVFHESTPYKMEGYWKSNQFYLDKYTPTNKFKEEHFIEIDCSSIDNLYNGLKSYLCNPKYELIIEDDTVHVYWIEYFEGES